MMKTKKILKAEQEIRRNLSNPGHKKELKEYNNMMRGAQAPTSRVVQTKVSKAKSRNAVKRETRRAIAEW